MSSVEGEEPTVPNYGHEVDELVSEPVAAEAEQQLGAEHDLEPESDEKQPFYKREITFRRKRGTPAPAPSELVTEPEDEMSRYLRQRSSAPEALGRSLESRRSRPSRSCDVDMFAPVLHEQAAAGPR